jgi:hypothetical protein
MARTNTNTVFLGGVVYQGTWNATTNSPALASSVGTQGHYYVVSVAGATDLNGITDWQVGDWAIFNGTVWQKVDNTDAVVSVNGQTGAVSLDTDDVPEGLTNFYVDSNEKDALDASNSPSSGNPFATLTDINVGLNTEIYLNDNGTIGSDSRLTFDPATNTFSVNDTSNPNGLKLIVNLTTAEGSMLINGVGIKVLPALTYIGNTNFNPGDAYMEFANGGVTNYTIPHGDFRITGTAGETINFQSTGGTPSTNTVTFVGTLPAYGGNTELLGTPGAWLYMENNGVPGVIPWYAL